MLTAIKIWNEPNNLSHWDFQMDPDWKQFSSMTKIAAREMKARHPWLTLVLGGVSPIDPYFIQLLDSYGTFEHLDAVAIHGFPLDWNHWSIYEWPMRVDEIKAITHLPVWITEVGVSTFGADEVQVFGLQKTTELLRAHEDPIFWYSLLDLPRAWGATTRHRESEGSSYYRHFYMGLVREDGSPKPAIENFDPMMGICQWFHFEDTRLDFAIEWLRRLKVRKLRTGISWADWHRPGGIEWYDRMMKKLEEFDTTVTLCFTPPSRGQRPDHTSPPLDLHEFAEFAINVCDRYVRS